MDETMNNKPCIICVAITGSLPKKENNPNVPISINEQIESTHQAFEIGATIAHCHVRNKDESPSSNPEFFSKLKADQFARMKIQKGKKMLA